DTFATGDLRWPGPDPDVGGGSNTDVGGRGGIGAEDSVNRLKLLGLDTEYCNDLQGESTNSPVPPAARSAARQLGDFLDAPPRATEVRAGRTRAQTHAMLEGFYLIALATHVFYAGCDFGST
ncbi:unnamed protein product, partial [Discosporangium mesarthrocarpum]